jgi:hypothetical protein
MPALPNPSCFETVMVKHQHLSYEGRQVVLLTKHGKQDLLKDAFESDLGCSLLHTDAFDTDQLGTFTRDVDRAGSQLEAARRKARIGMELTGVNIGIASEGSFGPDPFAGFFTWNTEILLWVDDELGIEVTGIANGPAQSIHREVKTINELLDFAVEAKFPEHHLVLRPEHQDHPNIYKNISDEQRLLNAFLAAKELSLNGAVFVENDLRAFCNPSRQEIIRNAAKDLVQKLRSTCPACSTPGYWRTKRIQGLRCSFCNQKTRLPVAEVWNCQSCSYENQQEIKSEKFADPSKCDFCNP